MGIDDEIRTGSICCKRHVALWYNETDGSLLTTATAELVSDWWVTLLTYTNLRNTEALFTVSHKCLVYVAQLTLLWRHRWVNISIRGVNCIGCPANENHFVREKRVFCNKSIVVKLTVVVSRLLLKDILTLNLHDFAVNHWSRHLATLFTCLIHRKIRHPEETTFDSTTINENGVLNVITSIRHNSNHRVHAIWMLFIVNVLHISTLNKWNLTVIEHDTHLIDANLVICVIERNTLLALSAWELITRHWVVFGEDDLIAHDTKNSCRVEFHVCSRFSHEITWFSCD